MQFSNNVKTFVGSAVIISLLLTTGLLAMGATFGDGEKKVTFYNIGSLEYDPGTAWNMERFVAENPEFKVEVAEVTWSQYKNKFSPALLTGATDAGEMWYGWLKPFVEKGLLEPLDGIVTEQEFDRYPRKIQNLIKFSDGHIYALPHYMNVDGFYYNEKKLKEEGFEEPPKNWEELIDYSQKLTKDLDGDGEIDQWGLVFPFKRPSDLILRYLDFLDSAGGNLFTNKGEPIISNDTALQTLKFMVDLRKKYGIVPKNITSLSPSDASRIFYKGKAAMMINYASESPRILNPEKSEVVDDARLTTLPNGPGGQTGNIATTIFIVVASGSKDKKGAKDLINSLTSWAAQQNMMIHEHGNVAPYPAISSSQRVIEEVPFAKAISRLVENAQIHVFPNHSKTEEAIEAQLELAMIGKKSPEEALNDAQSEVEKILS